LFAGRSILAVPNCGWTGAEADLLVVDERTLRLVEVEVKISRADLLADSAKDKWWWHRPWGRTRKQWPRLRREWPDKVWKHYYAMPASIWDDALLPRINEASGILLLSERPGTRTGVAIRVLRPAKPCREAKPITAGDAIDLARLASLRMWDALAEA